MLVFHTALQDEDGQIRRSKERLVRLCGENSIIGISPSKASPEKNEKMAVQNSMLSSFDFGEEEPKPESKVSKSIFASPKAQEMRKSGIMLSKSPNQRRASEMLNSFFDKSHEVSEESPTFGQKDKSDKKSDDNWFKNEVAKQETI